MTTTRHPSWQAQLLRSLYLSCLLCTTVVQATSPAGPVILIPGDGASALEVMYDDMHPPHFWCHVSSHNKWETLWIPNLSELLPRNIDCWSQKMKLYYNDTHVMNAPGVQGARATSGLTWMAKKTYKALIDMVDAQVLTYDFRLSPRGNPNVLRELKNMIEHASGDEKVTLVSHSLGGLLVHHFLTLFVGEEWKRNHIKSWIPIAPGYGGTKITLHQLISGDPVNIPFLKGKDIRDEQRSAETSVWLLPNVHLFDAATNVIVTTPTRNYTIADYHQLFQDVKLDTFPIQYDRVKNLTPWDDTRQQLADPNVTVYPIYGTGLETIERLVYDNDDLMDNDPKQIITSPKGDGTINLLGLQAGNHWRQSQPPLELDGVSHVDLLRHPKALQYIQSIVAMKGIPHLVAESPLAAEEANQ